jgi:undecaprenyl-diphosphatase
MLTGLALAALCVVLLAWLSEEVMENDTARFDDHVRALIHGESHPPLTQAMEVASDVGSPVAVALLTLTACIIFWTLGRRQDAALMAVTVVGASVLAYVLKISFRRARPVPFYGLAAPNSFSFPSGHALVALCFYGVLAYLVNSRIRSFGVRTGIRATAVFIFLVIGFSRIYLGVHYPSDVAAGYVAGIVWIAAIIGAVGRARSAEASGGPGSSV